MDKHYSVNTDGYSIRCKLYVDKPGEIKRIILFGHGFGGHKDNKAAERFARRVIGKNKGVGVITFDWPCHGEDARKLLRLSECDTYLRLMLADIEEHYAPEELFAYATSYGGYLFLKYISEHGNPFRKIALRCPAIDMHDVLVKNVLTAEELAKIGKGKPELVGFDRKVAIDQTFLDSVKEADIRQRDFIDFADDILILHGTKDEIIPPDTVKDFAENNVIDFIPVEAADHRFMNPASMDYAIVKIIDFFGMR